MGLLRPGVRRLFRIGDAARDVDEEIALHLELRIESLMARGMDRAAAEAEARHRFAASDRSIRDLRQSATHRNDRMHARERWASLILDLRYAARRLVREPMVALFIVLTLALGIGANAAAFSLVDRIILRGPQQVVEPGQLARLYVQTDGPPLGSRTMPWLPYTNYIGLREAMRGTRGMAAYLVRDGQVGSAASARRLRVGTADGAFFPLLGTRPLLGRLFLPDEDAATTGPVAVLSEGLWRTEYAGATDVLGKRVVINEIPHTIVGVAPAGFTGVSLERVDLWSLLNSARAGSNNWQVVVRTDTSTSLAALSMEAAAAHRQTASLAPRWGRWMLDATMLAAPIGYNDQARPALESVLAGWLAAISLIVLLIACANVVNLQLARLARRRQELGIRVALGAGRGRVVRLLALEGLLLSVVSGGVSLVVAAAVGPLLRSRLFENPGWSSTAVDGRALALVGCITVLTGVVVGVVPALRSGSPRLTAALHSGPRGGGGRSRVRQALTVVQAALSVLLLVGAGLFVRSLIEVRRVDLGMEPARVLVAETTYPSPTEGFEASATIERERTRQLVDALRSLPGVEAAALTIGLPFYSSFSVGVWRAGLDSIPSLPGGGPYATAVGPEYFATMGTALRSGRRFSEGDREGSAPVVIVGETMARLLWPDGDALEQCLTLFERTSPCAQVVGVVADLHHSGLREEPSLQFYVPMGQERGFAGTSIIIRPAVGANLAWPIIKERLFATDPNLRAVNITRLDAALDGEMRPLRLGMLAFGVSGLLALVVAALGLYSVIAYMVAWRTQEIGVRMALGATQGSVARLVVVESGRLAGIGVLLGLVVAYLCRGWVEPQLFETSAADPVVYLGVAAALSAVALLAGWLPARRAAAIRPSDALRAE